MGDSASRRRDVLHGIEDPFGPVGPCVQEDFNRLAPSICLVSGVWGEVWNGQDRAFLGMSPVRNDPPARLSQWELPAAIAPTKGHKTAIAAARQVWAPRRALQGRM